MNLNLDSVKLVDQTRYSITNSFRAKEKELLLNFVQVAFQLNCLRFYFSSSKDVKMKKLCNCGNFVVWQCVTVAIV